MKRALRAIAWLGMVPFAALADGDLPPLQPPHSDLLPTFWEQYHWAVVAGALAALALLVLLIVWLRRPRPAIIVPPDVIARRELEALRGQPENGVLLMKVSGILRRYVIFACGLPPGELTTTEVCRAVAERTQFSPDLANAINGFFRQCDERKFAPAPPASDLGAVGGALALLEKIEQRRRELLAQTPPSSPVPAAASPQP